LCANVCSGQTAQFYRLGALPGGSGSSAFAISGDGSVVVGVSDSPQGPQAFAWRPGVGMVALGDLPGGEFESFATGSSFDGSVVVGTGTGPLGPLGWRCTLTLAPQSILPGPLVPLPTIPGGDGRSNATAVSADGCVVVGHGTAADGTEAFRWTIETGTLSLGDLFGGGPGGSGTLSSAESVSADGTHVTGYASSPQGFRAFLWSVATGMGYLPEPSSGGVGESAGYAVSGTGGAVVGYQIAEGGYAGFVWTPNGGTQPLSLPFDPVRMINANALSGSGEIAVGEATIGSSSVAAIWEAGYGTRDLRALLVGQYGLGSVLSGWTLTTAYGVSADGLRIVGEGINPQGGREAWLVAFDGAICHPPIPPAFVEGAELPALAFTTLQGTATGTAPLHYQWRRNGAPLAEGGTFFGVQTPQLLIGPADQSIAGFYDVLISNACGTALSPLARVRLAVACSADFDNSGMIDPDDLADFIAAYFSVPPDPRCDVDASGNIDPDDLSDFIAAYFVGC
jgi:probable HAF family extracellular repeat protein